MTENLQPNKREAIQSNPIPNYCDGFGDFPQ